MHCAGQALAVGDQAKALLAQQPTDGGVTDAVCLCAQPRGNRAQAYSHPFLSICRQTSDVVVDDFLDLLFYRWTFFSSVGRPPPGLRTRSVGRPAKSSFNSRRPRRIVLTFIPVICASRSVPPCPMRSASNATYQRRCCSLSRLSKTFMRWWSSLSAWGCGD